MAGQGPLIMVKSGHFPVRADGACSGHGQQLAGMSGATPALTCRDMTLIWRPGALVMVAGLVPGQECLVLLMIHSETRAARREARELPRKPGIQLPQGYADAIFVYNPGLG